MAPKLLQEHTTTLQEKVGFLKKPEAYGETNEIESLETHMSWLFFTRDYVFKLKKPVCLDFLDFRTLEARSYYCREEIKVNRPLAGDTYVEALPLRKKSGSLNIGRNGKIVDWLVKMKRLPDQYMLNNAMKAGIVRKEWVISIAEKLTHFYSTSVAENLSLQSYRENLINVTNTYSNGLLDKEFRLSEPQIINIQLSLLEYLLKNADVFKDRIQNKKIKDTHGDLRPEHICLFPQPAVIDRIEFNKQIRVQDVAEELSFLALECEFLKFPAIGDFFINIYKLMSNDKIPGSLICFYKAKRAMLRANLSIQHLREAKYLAEEPKWRNRCETYITLAEKYIKKANKLND